MDECRRCVTLLPWQQHLWTYDIQSPTEFVSVLIGSGNLY